MSGPRVAIIGPRRERHGLGPFVARDLVRAGATVPCFLATSATTRDEAQAELSTSLGIETRGHLDLHRMLAAEELDAVAILSPAETHVSYLEASVRAGLHVLCEKPFVWGCASLGERAAAVTAACDDRGLCLWENCQWPYMLPFFERLFPGTLDAPPRRIEMTLQPGSAGAQALGDTLPHVISVAQALVPGDDAQLEEVAFESVDPGADRQCVRFVHRTEKSAAEVTVRLARSSALPREAVLSVDGCSARRVVSGESYELSFADDDRSVPMDDPLTLLVGDFVAELRREEKRSRSREIAVRMKLLARIVEAYRDAGGEVEEEL